MLSHAPAGYECPFCALVAGRDTELNAQSDVVLRDAHTTAFISPKWWESCPGHAIVVPNEHYENLYEIPDASLGAVYAAAARVARALRASYDCDGTSTRQHNEPGGGQDVWHFHVHVFPRREKDDLYGGDVEVRWTTPEERAPFAARLTSALSAEGPAGAGRA